MTSNPFGLDIGAKAIKTVWLSQTRQGFILNAALTYPAPAKGILSESPIDQEEMVQSIKKVVELTKISTKNVNIALGENQVYTKVVEMPSLSEKELSSAIYWEAEQYIPVALSNVTMDWKILRRSKEDQSESKMQVLLVGAPNSLVDKYKKILSKAGLNPFSVETEILSCVRALTYSPEKNENTNPPLIVVHMGAVNTSLAIIKDGILLFTYSVPVGGNAINRAIADDFGLTIQQAEEYKKVYGVSEKILGGKISKLTEAILMSILGEVKKALAFYSEKYRKETPVRQIVLSGGTAKLPGINLFFAKNCGIETITANPWKILARQDIPQDMQDCAPDYTVAIGLAMRDYD